jgi:plastocyanin
MKKKSPNAAKIVFPNFAVILAFILPLIVHASTHTVRFGGSLGLVYSPATFTAIVGDTVVWSGDFTMHPISSTTIPAGATTWHNATGTTFSYVIRVAGTYNYQCDFHISQGMIASFTAATSAVLPVAVTEKNPTPDVVFFSSSGKTFLRLKMQAAEYVSVAFFSLGGKKSASFVNTRLGPGNHTVSVQGIRPGRYCVRISAGERKIIRDVLVTR